MRQYTEEQPAQDLAADTEEIHLTGERMPVERDEISGDNVEMIRQTGERLPVAHDEVSGDNVEMIRLTGDRIPVEHEVATGEPMEGIYLSGERMPVAREDVSGEPLEGIYLSERRTAVAHEKTSVKDEAADYKFATRKRRSHSRSHSHSHSHAHSHAHAQNQDQTFTADDLVRSTRGTHSHTHTHSNTQTKNRTPSQDFSSDDLVQSTRSSKKHKKHHHHHHHWFRNMKRWKKILLIAVSVLLALVIAVGATFLYLRNQGHSELLDGDLQVMVPETVGADVQDDGDYIVYKGQTYRFNKNITSLLFLGVDKRSIEGLNEEGTGGQADVLVVIALDMKTHKMTMLALPRDTVAEVAMYTPGGNYNGMKNTQVCLAYAYGDGKETSCDNTIASVRRVFYNIPIKTYYALDLDGIAAVNDSVGGVDVTSPETIEAFTEGVQYHLMGNSAERFVRARVHDRIDASLLRLNRQKIYARGFLSQLLSSIKKDVTSAVRLYNDSAPYSCTNLNAARVAYLASELATGGTPDAEMLTVPGEMTYENELALYKVDDEQFFEQFLSVYYEKM